LEISSTPIFLLKEHLKKVILTEQE